MIDYLSSKDALAILWQRRQNSTLIRQVENFVNMPSCLLEQPMAVLARAIATPNFECLNFFKQNLNGLSSILLEFTADKFLAVNKSKVALGKMGVYCSRGRDGSLQIKYHRLVDLKENNGKPLGKVKTIYGSSLLSLHHYLFEKLLPQAENLDMSDWLQQQGGRAEQYYTKFLSLFICHGILFEFFDTKGEEKYFTTSVVEPAVGYVKSIFQHQPLVVRLKVPDGFPDYYGNLYPTDVESLIQEFLNKQIQ